MLYPVIDPYPLQERPPSQIELILAESRGESLAPLQSVDTPYDLMKMVVLHKGNNLVWVLNSKLDSSSEYKEAKRYSPTQRNFPGIKIYQNDYRSADLAQVDREVHSMGYKLSRGQVLFHGGIWPNSNGRPHQFETISVNRPLSTSLDPSVALVHSGYHCKRNRDESCHKAGVDADFCEERFGPVGIPSVWVLNVKQPIAAAVFSKRGNLKHEKEVLVASGGKVTCKGCEDINGTLIIDCDIE